MGRFQDVNAKRAGEEEIAPCAMDAAPTAFANAKLESMGVTATLDTRGAAARWHIAHLKDVGSMGCAPASSKHANASLAGLARNATRNIARTCVASTVTVTRL